MVERNSIDLGLLVTENSLNHESDVIYNFSSWSTIQSSHNQLNKNQQKNKKRP